VTGASAAVSTRERLTVTPTGTPSGVVASAIETVAGAETAVVKLPKSRPVASWPLTTVRE
jgi:hypothetical protein